MNSLYFPKDGFGAVCVGVAGLGCAGYSAVILGIGASMRMTQSFFPPSLGAAIALSAMVIGGLAGSAFGLHYGARYAEECGCHRPAIIKACILGYATGAVSGMALPWIGALALAIVITFVAGEALAKNSQGAMV
jgi:hypothetical protein